MHDVYQNGLVTRSGKVASDANESANALLDLLGWRHARTGPKGRPFKDRFQVLGCSLDLTEVRNGVVVTENRPGRIDRILEHLEKVKAANTLSLHEAQIVHGLLRYACGFFAGRNLHQVCAKSWPLGWLNPGGDLVIWRGFVTSLPGLSKAASHGNCQQIELYAMVALRWALADLLKDAIWWVDNEAARYATIKGISPSLVMRQFVRMFYSFEAESPAFSWSEREWGKQFLSELIRLAYEVTESLWSWVSAKEAPGALA
eukprot:s649_g30.t1